MAVLFYWEKGKDLNASARERDERDRRQWRKKGSVRSEQTRSIESEANRATMFARCAAAERRRRAARRNLSISAKKVLDFSRPFLFPQVGNQWKIPKESVVEFIRYREGRIQKVLTRRAKSCIITSGVLNIGNPT